MGPSGMKAHGLGVKNLNKTTTTKWKFTKNVQNVKQETKEQQK